MTKRAQRSGPAQLRSYLTKHRQTQTELAAELGISNAHLSEVLSGHVQPSLTLAVRVENLTGIPARDFAHQQKGA